MAGEVCYSTVCVSLRQTFRASFSFRYGKLGPAASNTLPPAVFLHLFSRQTHLLSSIHSLQVPLFSSRARTHTHAHTWFSFPAVVMAATTTTAPAATAAAPPRTTTAAAAATTTGERLFVVCVLHSNECV